MFNLQLNVYTAAISSVNKIVINELLRLIFSGFLLRREQKFGFEIIFQAGSYPEFDYFKKF